MRNGLRSRVTKWAGSMACALLVLTACARPLHGAQVSPAFPGLAEADRKLLDGLYRQFLFDPTGAEYVEIKASFRTAGGDSRPGVRNGWLVSPKAGHSARVCFADGETVPAPQAKDIKKLDIVSLCRERYGAKAPPASLAGQKTPPRDDDADRDERFRSMGRTAIGEYDPSNLATAAWLYRLGQPELAARALQRARAAAERKRASRSDQKRAAEGLDAFMVRKLREDLAWHAFAGMIHAYMVRADEEALSHGERLLRLYPEEAKAYSQAATVVAELKRRKQKGTFGKAPPFGWPEGFSAWEIGKRVEWWIDALEEVDARQWGQPGGVALAVDRRVQALIQLGDPAVPRLIDAIEKDDRLTRSVHFWRDFSRGRTVLSVREAALCAVMSILQVRVFEADSTGDNFTSRGPAFAKQVAARLRAYWKTYGSLPLDERMMKVLCDRKSSPEATREAAGNLARLGQRVLLSTMAFGESAGPKPRTDSPAVAKFTKPTVAEAILAAMDRDLAARDAGKRDNLHDYERRRIEDQYLRPLAELGDKRIAAELAARAKAAESLRMRRKYALPAHQLGDPEPMKALARDFQAGTLKLPGGHDPNTREDEQPEVLELKGVIECLVLAQTPECGQALNALARPDYPQHALAAKWIRRSDVHGFDDELVWLSHPFCIAVLQASLNDTKPTGGTYKIEADWLTIDSPGGGGSTSVPDFLEDPATRRKEAKERVCDAAALKISKLVFGLVPYHPLFADADRRLEELKVALKKYEGRFRLMTDMEKEALQVYGFGVKFLVDFRPLGRPATAKDVAEGKAVFHLDGKGQPAKVTLPAVAVRKGADTERRPSRVLIVQAEVRPDGETLCGVLGPEGTQTLRLSQLTGVVPVSKRTLLDMLLRPRPR